MGRTVTLLFAPVPTARRRGHRLVGVTAILSWWDGVELWLSGLGFVLQTLIVMPVVLALAYGIALVVDAALGNGIRALHWIRHEQGRDK